MLCAAISEGYAPWVRLAILTGMRQSEQFGLKWADLDPKGNMVTLAATKEGEVQYIHLNEEAQGIIEGLKEGNTSVWVFPSENPETHLDPINFYHRVYVPAVKQAGL